MRAQKYKAAKENRPVNVPKHEDPHIKLYLLDTINFLMGLLPGRDRKAFILDLYE